MEKLKSKIKEMMAKKPPKEHTILEVIQIIEKALVKNKVKSDVAFLALVNVFTKVGSVELKDHIIREDFYNVLMEALDVYEKNIAQQNEQPEASAEAPAE